MADVSVEAAGITGLTIRWAAGSVDVVVIDDVGAHAIELTETAPRPLGETQRMRWRVVGSTLEVEFGSWFECFLLGRKDLEVRIPRAFASAFERVNVEGSSGLYQVRDIGCGTMKLKLASGRIDVDRVAARGLSIDVASGYVSAVGRFDESPCGIGGDPGAVRRSVPAIDRCRYRKRQRASGHSRVVGFHGPHHEGVRRVQERIPARAVQRRLPPRRRLRPRDRPHGQRHLRPGQRGVGGRYILTRARCLL